LFGGAPIANLFTMNLHQTAAAIMFLLSATASTPAAASEGPVQELRARVDRAVQVLSDPAVKGPSKVAERRAQVRKIADEIFDYAEMSKRSLGVHWQQLSTGDRERFMRSFSDLLDRTYFEKIDSYNGEKVRYMDVKITGNQATVPTRVTTDKGTEIPVEYRMHRDQGRWMVLDVVIEGVSLVSNYRAQFDRIIKTSSTGELMKRLEAQVAGQAGGPREPRGR
jgi:phospholipid transport system substrate-binding protein